jgi:hypothetical protein
MNTDGSGMDGDRWKIPCSQKSFDICVHPFLSVFIRFKKFLLSFSCITPAIIPHRPSAIRATAVQNTFLNLP